MIHKSKKRIAICFFGITRSLKFTIDSIRKNILEPAEKIGEVRVYSHFFKQVFIENPRSKENGRLCQNEYQLLPSDWIKLEQPDNCLLLNEINELKKFGDEWGDDFRSLRNLVHQLHSLDQVTNAALQWEPNIVIFSRPDLRYHDTLINAIKQDNNKPTVRLPSWQQWKRGYNDRFAIADSRLAAYAYGSRIRLVRSFCEDNDMPLHSELLLKYALQQKSIGVKFINTRASRVRSDSSQVNERFHPFVDGHPVRCVYL